MSASERERIRAMLTGREVLVCGPWANRPTVINCVMRACVACTANVAIDEQNLDTITRRNMVVVCGHCFEIVSDTATTPRALIGGADLSLDEAADVLARLMRPQKGTYEG